MNRFYDFKHKTYPHVGRFYLPSFTVSLVTLAHPPHQVCVALRNLSGVQVSESTVRVKCTAGNGPRGTEPQRSVIKTLMPRVPDRCQYGQGENVRSASYLKLPGWRGAWVA